MSKTIAVSALLIDIESELRQLRLWDAEAPSAAALASREPFCIDTLSFPQWLQFIFLPRMHAIIDQKSELPTACSVAPMAEESFKGRFSGGQQLFVKPLIATLAQLDQLLSA